MSKVSVIIPAYNASSLIEECLTALQNQTYPLEDYEIIVVNDGSTDDTGDIAQSAGVKVVHQENQGPAMARNCGVTHAVGEIIVFTDSDCIASENFLTEMIRPFSDPAVVGVKGAYRTKQTRLWARFAQVEFMERYVKLSRSESIDFVDSYAAAFRKRVFQKVGGFDPHFPVANNEDVDLSYKIAGMGHPMVFNPDAIVYHTHPDSMKTYLKLKFSRAYWRMLVYRRFPEKIVSDSYTPQSLKCQILMTCFMLLAFFGGLFSTTLLYMGFGFLGLFLLATTPFVFRAISLDRGVALFSPVAVFLRSLAFGLGICFGLISQNRRNIIIPSLLFTSDVIAAFGAYLGSFWIRSSLAASFMRPFDHPLSLYLTLFPLVLLIWVISCQSLGLYQEKSHHSRVREFTSVTRAVSYSVLTIIVMSFYLRWDYSRFFILTYWILGLVFANVLRTMVRRFQDRLRRKGLQNSFSVIVGTGESARRLLHCLKDLNDEGQKLVGVVDDVEPDPEIEDWKDIPWLGKISELERIIRKTGVDDVYIAKTDWPQRKLLDLVVECEKTGAGFKIISDLTSIVTGGAMLSSFSGLPVIDLKEERHDWGRRACKRLMDIVLGSIFFLVVFPVMLFTGLIVHFITPGSVLVEQERVGKNGRLFKMLRFRTYSAKNNLEKEELSFFGGLLQRTHIDELPQLLNVIRGEMSLVGPRPEVPEIVNTYESWQRKRLDVAPGLTGLWQILGPSGKPLHEDLEYDFYYIKNYSIWMDVSILVQTIPVIFAGKGEVSGP